MAESAGEVAELLDRVCPWAGSKERAVAWYRTQPLPSFGGRTAEALAQEGRLTAVRAYLDRLDLGGYA